MIAQQKPTEADLLIKEVAIRSNSMALLEADKLLWHERAKRASDWIIANAAEKTFGVEPKMLRIAEDDDYGLAAFEDYGRRGNAVLLHESDLGQIWWCDPEGQESAINYFAHTKGAGCAVCCEIRFVSP